MSTNGRAVRQRERTSTKPIYRADVVGSMLRPPELRAAREAFLDGELSAGEYRARQDRAVDAALRIQEDAGLDVVTDGEMRRDVYLGFLLSAVTGMGAGKAWPARFRNDAGEPVMEFSFPLVVTDKLRATGSPALEEYLYARERTDLPVKITLPSPTHMVAFWTRDASSDAYPEVFELVADAAEIVRTWVSELFEAGCRFVQIDAPDFNQVFADEAVRAHYAAHGVSPERFMAEAPELLDAVTRVDRPAGTTLGLHLCKGNGTQSHLAAGGYERLAREVLRRSAGFDVFHFEFDDDRSGSFEPLRHLAEDKVASLGLVSTKWTALESVDLLRTRIDEASRYHPHDRLAVAPQCGFASAAEGAEQRRVTEQMQIDKLRLVAETARAVWG